jgi:hypothetical protein
MIFMSWRRRRAYSSTDVAGPGDLREIREHLGHVGRQRATRIRTGRAESIQEPLGPGAERLDALGTTRVVRRQQRLEFHVAAVEHGAALLEQLVQRAMAGARAGRTLRRLWHQLLKPFGRQIDAPRAQRADEAAVRLRRRHGGPTRRQRLRDLVVTDRDGHRGYRTTAPPPRPRIGIRSN